eukprot:1178365-Prorocentrum_minimum.AAC.1
MADVRRGGQRGIPAAVSGRRGDRRPRGGDPVQRRRNQGVRAVRRHQDHRAPDQHAAHGLPRGRGRARAAGEIPSLF